MITFCSWHGLFSIMQVTIFNRLLFMDKRGPFASLLTCHLLYFFVKMNYLRLGFLYDDEVSSWSLHYSVLGCPG
jgi:hypothetical protein